MTTLDYSAPTLLTTPNTLSTLLAAALSTPLWQVHSLDLLHDRVTVLLTPEEEEEEEEDEDEEALTRPALRVTLDVHASAFANARSFYGQTKVCMCSLGSFYGPTKVLSLSSLTSMARPRYSVLAVLLILTSVFRPRYVCV